MNALKRAINHRFQFMRVFDFAAFGQTATGFCRVEPGRIARRFIGAAQLMYFRQEGLNHEFLHAARLPENTFGVKVEMKVTWLNGAQNAGLFRSLAFSGLAVREMGIDAALWEGPLISAVGIDQQKLHYGPTPAA